MPKFYASVAAIALAALLGWQGYRALQSQSADAFAECRSGAVAGGEIGGPFTLTDTKGNAVTDATLLAAMTGISRFVEDAAIKQILRDTDGLGTEATRAGIIELLFKRGFLQRSGKQIHATATGVALINALPAEAVTPNMTARWEAALNAICQRQQSYQAFMQPLLQQLQLLIQGAANVTPVGLPTQPSQRWLSRKNAAVKGTQANRRYRRKTTDAAVSKAKRN